MPSPNAFQRAQQWLAAKLGPRYAVLVSTLDRAVTAFVLAVLTKLLGGDVLDVGALATLSFWQTAGYAGVLAALSVLKSALFTGITGSPALLSPVSRTLRARRDNGYRPQHKVPVRPPARGDGR